MVKSLHRKKNDREVLFKIVTAGIIAKATIIDMQIRYSDKRQYKLSSYTECSPEYLIWQDSLRQCYPGGISLPCD